MKKFNSVDELFKDIEKNHTLWDKIILYPSMEWLRWLIYNAKDAPNEFYRKCKRGWQRAYWGLADEDTWELDYYLSKIILRGLKQLKETKRGCPIIVGFDCESNFEEMDKEWNKILDSMIWTFETTQKIQNDNWLILPEKGFTEKEMTTLSKNFHVMTKEEMAQYNKGWYLFQCYYYSLWD